jgi:ankyrin repeat protein
MKKMTKLCGVVCICVSTVLANNDVNKKNLLDVAKQGSVWEVKKLLELGVDVNMQGSGGRTALHVASMLGFAEIVEILIAHKANVNCVDVDNATPLHMAVLWFGKENVLKALLNAGADPNIRDKNGTTPLFYAATGRRAKSSRVVVDLLMAYGAKGLDEVLKFAIRNKRTHIVKMCVDFGGDDLLTKCRFNPLHEAIKTGNADIVSMLLGCGASVDSYGEKKMLPLRLAVHKGLVEIVTLLIKHGADTCEKNDEENSLLHDAVWYGASRDKREKSSEIYGETINILLLNGAYINVRDSHERTPLHIAAICGMSEIIRILLAHRAEKDAKDRHGKTALEYAKIYRETGVYGDVSTYDKTIEALNLS